MARLKLVFPDPVLFTANIPVRITDLNYGGHVGNDTLLSIIQEARMQLLASHGYTELQFAGAGMIMTEASLEFKAELFYGDTVKAEVAMGEISKVGFEFYYRLTKRENEKVVIVALAKTGMICYDYQKKKVVPVPEAALRVFSPSMS